MVLLDDARIIPKELADCVWVSSGFFGYLLSREIVAILSFWMPGSMFADFEDFTYRYFIDEFLRRNAVAILIGKNVVLNQPFQILSPLFLRHLFNSFDGDYHFRSPMFTTFFVDTFLFFKASSFSS